MTKVQAVSAFFERLTQGEEDFLVNLMHQEMGPELVQFFNQYGQAFTEKIGQVENLAGSLLILGYLVRAYEDGVFPAEKDTVGRA